MARLEHDQLKEELKKNVKEIKNRDSEIKALKESNRRMQAELIELKDQKAFSDQLLDRLESAFESMGLKVVKDEKAYR